MTYYVLRAWANGPIVNGIDCESLEAAQAFADQHMTPGIVAERADVRSMEYREYEARWRGGDYE